MKMKLIELDTRDNIATLKCECGGWTLMSTTGLTKAMPHRAHCPVCNKPFDYPTDLKT